MAHAIVSTDLAKVAGMLLARSAGIDQDMEKAASLMVQTGALSEEDFLLEKEAGFAGLRSLFSQARGGLSGIRRRMGGMFQGKTAPYKPSKAAKGWSAGPKKAPEGMGGVKGAKEGKKGFGWGKALPWMAVGGLGYGAYKGIPAAVRTLEATSTTPMAQGLGWSPVAYGYGHTPYGPGMATMGAGA
jgi:hypothetical protein